LHRRFLLQGLAFWPAFPVLAVANGALRDALLAPAIGPALALPISGVTFLILMLLVIKGFLVLSRAPRSRRDLWLLGTIWAALAILFEFVVFGAILGTPWTELVQAFDPSDGNLFSVVILGVLIGPRVIAAVGTRPEGEQADQSLERFHVRWNRNRSG
jgi:hypothetical protein